VVIVRRTVAISAILIVLAAVWFSIQLFQPFSGNGHGAVTVTIPSGAGTSRIADILERDRVVPSAFFFELRARLSGDKLFAGAFTMPLGTTYSRALQILSVEPKLRAVNVIVVDGLSRRQIAAKLRREHVRGNYMAATRHSRQLDPAAYGAPRRTPYLEGFLYPDTYQLRVPARAGQLVAKQLSAFKHEIATVSMSWARAHHLTPYDVLIVASLTEAEATRESDRPIVASVIYNRLAAGIELGLDTTVAYATGDYSGTLTPKELASRSPWNTRNHHGLPPTPINNPTVSAIQAAAHPAHTNYIYFITKVCGHGALAFTASAQRFAQLSSAYNSALAAHGLRGAEFCNK
jgi:UPF0755 protein